MLLGRVHVASVSCQGWTSGQEFSICVGGLADWQGVAAEFFGPGAGLVSLNRGDVVQAIS